jgi:4-aminobutyrate aminotransferase-like enzyme
MEFLSAFLVEDRITYEAGTEISDHVKNRMPDHRILVGSEGRKDNILEIRPPLMIDNEGVDMTLQVMSIVLNEATILRQ